MELQSGTKIVAQYTIL